MRNVRSTCSSRLPSHHSTSCSRHYFLHHHRRHSRVPTSRPQMNSVCWSLSVHFAWPIAALPSAASPSCRHNSQSFIPLNPHHPKLQNPKYLLSKLHIHRACSYIAHLLLLALVGTFVAHVQVIMAIMIGYDGDNGNRVARPQEAAVMWTTRV
jgi:hypothetical protein